LPASQAWLFLRYFALMDTKQSATQTIVQSKLESLKLTGTAQRHGFGTRSIHAGQAPDPTSGAVIIPISLSTTFQQVSPGVHRGWEYARTGNPTRDALEANIASLENAKWGAAFASGLAATASVTALLPGGSHIVCMDDVYGGTRRYFSRIAQPQGYKVSYVDFNNSESLEKAITSETRMMWLETPTNPLLKVVDISETARIAKKHNVLFVVDNTFLSPYFQNPLDLGADLVLHSCTKYINGHSDVVMGIVCGNDTEIHKRLKFVQNGMGAVPSAFDSFLVLRGTKTLHIRMREHERNALQIAQWLERHPKVERVLYPGLPSHPQHHIAKKQQRGFGGMVTFFLKGGLRESRQFLESLRLFALAESLGGVESLVDHPAIMTHASVPPEERAKLGISDSLVRLSVGLEDVDDLIHDLSNALDQVNL
jgi:cystathionine gamma-lyase